MAILKKNRNFMLYVAFLGPMSKLVVWNVLPCLLVKLVCYQHPTFPLSGEVITNAEQFSYGRVSPTIYVKILAVPGRGKGCSHQAKIFLVDLILCTELSNSYQFFPKWIFILKYVDLRTFVVKMKCLRTFVAKSSSFTQIVGKSFPSKQITLQIY